MILSQIYLRSFSKKGPEHKPPIESLQEKVLKAYVRMKEKAAKRNKRRRRSSGSKWRPQVGDLVLAKCQGVSDAADGVTKKFARPYDGPWKVTRVVNPTAYEVAVEQDVIRKVYNQSAVKLYLPPMGRENQAYGNL
jgi:hypothetical protein